MLVFNLSVHLGVKIHIFFDKATIGSAIFNCFFTIIDVHADFKSKCKVTHFVS